MVAQAPSTTRSATANTPRSTHFDDPLLEPLLKLLESGVTDLATLCQQLDTTPKQVTAAMNSDELHNHIDTQTRLAQTAFRLRVIKLLPLAAKALEANLTCDKPEVVRRTSIIVCHLNNLATSPPKESSYMPFGLHRR